MPFVIPLIESLYGTRLTKLIIIIIREYKMNLLAEFNLLANLPELNLFLKLGKFLFLLVMTNLGILFKAILIPERTTNHFAH